MSHAPDRQKLSLMIPKDVENLEPIQVNVSIFAATSQNNLEAPREIKNMYPLLNQQFCFEINTQKKHPRPQLDIIRQEFAAALSQ